MSICRDEKFLTAAATRRSRWMSCSKTEPSVERQCPPVRQRVHEMLELRDGASAGGVLHTVEAVNSEIFDALSGSEPKISGISTQFSLNWMAPTKPALGQYYTRRVARCCACCGRLARNPLYAYIGGIWKLYPFP